MFRRKSSVLIRIIVLPLMLGVVDSPAPAFGQQSPEADLAICLERAEEDKVLAGERNLEDAHSCVGIGSSAAVAAALICVIATAGFCLAGLTAAEAALVTGCTAAFFRDAFRIEDDFEREVMRCEEDAALGISS